MPAPSLAFTYLLDPTALASDLGCSDVAAAERVVRRATAAIEGRLRRRLVVRRHALTVCSTHDWARQWPVVLACEPAPDATPAPVELADVEYPVAYGYDEADDTGERLGLAEYPENGRLVVYAGYRRLDQGRDALNTALAALEPAWGEAPLSQAAYDRIPVLPAEITEAARALARGYLALDVLGGGALNSRREESGERNASAVRAANWGEGVLREVDRYAWVQL